MKIIKRQTYERGITLIALIVTIVVMLLLAGVSLQMFMGQNGLMNQADRSTKMSVHSEVYEQLNFVLAENYIEREIGRYTKTNSEIGYLLDQKLIYQQDGIQGYILDVEKLMGEKRKYGNGKDGKTDVYKLEEIAQEKTIKVTYYGKEEVIELGKIKASNMYN